MAGRRRRELTDFVKVRSTHIIASSRWRGRQHVVLECTPSFFFLPEMRVILWGAC